MVYRLRNVSTVRVDHWLERDATTSVPRLIIANPNGEDVPQMVNHCTAFNDRYMMFSSFYR